MAPDSGRDILLENFQLQRFAYLRNLIKNNDAFEDQWVWEMLVTLSHKLFVALAVQYEGRELKFVTEYRMLEISRRNGGIKLTKIDRNGGF